MKSWGFAVRLLAACVIPIASAPTLAQTLTPLVNQVPNGIEHTLLLTDGTVMAQDFDNADWWKLTPDIDGSYVNGTWTKLASLAYAPYAFASAVLADGRVIVMGGEYSGPNSDFTLTNQGAIYDPRSDTWTPVAPPQGWSTIGDSPSVVLPNGKFLLGNKLTRRMSELDPQTLQWSEVSSKGKSDFNAEEGWTLLPNGTVLTADVKNAPNSEVYLPFAQEWQSSGTTGVDLHSPSPFGCSPYPPNGTCYYPPGEIGPAILRQNGTVFATGSYANNDPNFDAGSAGHTAIYDTHKKTWTVGPDFPNNDNAGDSWAVLLPNGRVLVEGTYHYYGPGYEFDGSHLTLTTSLTDYLGPLTVLPTGEVLAGGYAGGSGFPTQVYDSTGTYDRSWAPVIYWVEDSRLKRGITYRIWGKQFNGLSQAQAFGDELQAAQNYPLVRITNKSTHHVFYARTHDHSTMGVATGNQTVWTDFDVPATMEPGDSALVVVANGIPSEPIDVHVH